MILLPTRRRTKLLAQCFEALKRTETESEGLVIVDTKDYLENEKEYIRLETNAFLPGWKIKTTTAETMGDKVREVWSMVKDKEWVGIINDDHVPVTPNWDKKLVELLDGTNMVSCNDGFWNAGIRVCGATLWSMPLLDAVGFPIFPRNLQHLYIDDVWKAIGEVSGCWLDTMTVNVEHRHAVKGEMEQDETFKKVYAQESWDYDQKEFEHFMNQDFKAVIKKVLDLRAKVDNAKFS